MIVPQMLRFWNIKFLTANAFAAAWQTRFKVINRSTIRKCKRKETNASYGLCARTMTLRLGVT